MSEVNISIQDNSTQKIIARPATLAELHLAAQRQLVFEEPVSRFARLKKTIQRQLNRPARDVLKELNCYEIAALHGSIFATAAPADLEDILASLIFSLALAFDDFRLFSNTAFSAFKLLSLEASPPFDDKSASALLRLAARMAETLQLDSGRKQWLGVSLLARLNWSAVAEEAVAKIFADLRRQQIITSLRIRPDQKALFEKGDITLDPILDALDLNTIIKLAKPLEASLRQSLRPSLVVLVEGQSEAIVLPHFANLCGYSFEKLGVMVIASGGAQQVARRYLTLKDVLQIPIVCLFDGDAEASSGIIEEDMRACDGLICLESTELEDCYSYEQLLKILDLQMVHNDQSLLVESLSSPSSASGSVSIPRQGPRKAALNKLFRSRGLGDFDKIEFAKSAVDLTVSEADVPAEMKRVIGIVRSFNDRNAAG